MLTELSIRDIALFPELRLEFGPGLNVFSGETGAGKSLVVGSLRLLCGERAPAGVVRTGASRGVVEGVFDLDPSGWIAEELSALGLELDGGELILRREIGANGRGRARANGDAIPIGTLARASELLIDLHGHHQHQSLLRPAFQLNALDDYAELHDERERFRIALGEWKELSAELDALRASSRDDEARRELARFQLRELDEADPEAGELARCRIERGRLEQAEQLRSTAARIVNRLTDGDGPVRDTFAELEREAADAAAHDPGWESVSEALGSLAISAGETARDARRLGEAAVDDPVRLEYVRERERRLEDLYRKYGPEEAGLFAFWEGLRAEAEDPEARDRRLEALQARVLEISDKLRRSGTKLSRRRKTASSRFREEVLEVLTELGMEGTRFEARVSPREKGIAFAANDEARAGAAGLDDVEWLLSANRGEALRPLAQVASGGEISRVMLSLKSVLGKSRGTATMVFDEIDAGVGGRIAGKIATVLSAIAGHHQVLCITHLAAIASRARVHLRVSKERQEDRTVSRVEPVEGEARVLEIARMLGAGGKSGIAVDHARELLKEALP